MRITVMQVECDLCDTLSSTFDMALMSLSDVIGLLREKGWYRARGSCQDLCPECNRKRASRRICSTAGAVVVEERRDSSSRSDATSTGVRR
jgi:hypothetical protein